MIRPCAGRGGTRAASRTDAPRATRRVRRVRHGRRRGRHPDPRRRRRHRRPDPRRDHRRAQPARRAAGAARAARAASGRRWTRSAAARRSSPGRPSTCPTTATWSSSWASCSTTRTPCGPTRSSGPATPYTPTRPRAVRGRDPVRLRRRELGDRAVLLPARPEGLHRPRLLPRAQQPVRGAGRLRAGVRDRARDRPPRAAADGHRAAGAPAPAVRTRPARTSCP